MNSERAARRGQGTLAADLRPGICLSLFFSIVVASRLILVIATGRSGSAARTDGAEEEGRGAAARRGGGGTTQRGTEVQGPWQAAKLCSYTWNMT